MSMLLRRMMWPKKGEDIAIYKNGALVAEGKVNNVDEWSVSVITRRFDLFRMDAAELLRGIDDKSIVIKKKQSVQ